MFNLPVLFKSQGFGASRRIVGIILALTALGVTPGLSISVFADDNPGNEVHAVAIDTHTENTGKNNLESDAQAEVVSTNNEPGGSETGPAEEVSQGQVANTGKSTTLVDGTGVPVATAVDRSVSTNGSSEPRDQVVTLMPPIPADISLVPQAQSVDLSKPVEQPDLSVSPTSDPISTELEPKPNELEPTATASPQDYDQPLIILGAKVPPGTSTRLSWKPDQSFEGIAAPTPVLVVNGAQAGPTLCLTAAIHGDELNGIEMVRRILYETEPEKLHGTLIGVPIVNLHGFHRTSRYLPDRRDLNRYFPGNPRGSSASRIAYSFFNEIIRHCDALVDLHTGSFHRTNLPQVRADLTQAAIVDLSQSFGATVVLHNAGTQGTLRRAAADAGIPAITLEAGEPMRLQQAAVNHGVKGIETLLNKLAMYKRIRFWGDPEPVFYRSQWIRAEQGGILFSEVELGQNIRIGELLGTVTDPITNVRAEIHSPFKGRVLGRALDQVVMPGFAAFRIGIETSEQDVLQENSNTDGAVGDGEDTELEAAKIMNKARALDASREQDQEDVLETSE